jgi:DNA-binding beta-propeller fold protein YncE
MRHALILFAVSIALAAATKSAASAAPDEPLLIPARTIPLTGVGGPVERNGIAGRLDHMAYDPATHRLFLAAFARGSLEVVDLDQGALIKSLEGIPQAQGVAVVPALGSVFVASGGDGKIRSFDTKTLQQRGSVFAVADADNMRFDQRSGRVWVGGGSPKAGAVLAFDPATLARITQLPLPAHAESFQVDPDGPRMFINVPGAKTADNAGSVVVADREKGIILATWTLAGAARNFPMALDLSHGRIFVVSRKPPQLIALDDSTGRVLAAAPCAADCDDIGYDPKTNRIYLIGGGRRVNDGAGQSVERDQPGSLDVFALSDREKISKIGSVALPPHARTGLFVPSRRAIYVAVPVQAEKSAELLEFQVKD